MSQDDDPPVAGSSFLVSKPKTGSKWSRRGHRMRKRLLVVWKIVAAFVTLIRTVRWVVENL